MTPEEMKFWLDMFHSPVAIALAGGVAGSFITLVVTLLTLWHKSKESKEEWDRQERRRKEERIFNLKNQAYRDFMDIIDLNYEAGKFDFSKEGHIRKILLLLFSYGSCSVRNEAKKCIATMNNIINKHPYQDRDNASKDFFASINSLSYEISIDILSHHELLLKKSNNS